MFWRDEVDTEATEGDMSDCLKAEVSEKFSSPSTSRETSAEGGHEGSEEWKDDRRQADPSMVVSVRRTSGHNQTMEELVKREGTRKR